MTDQKRGERKPKEWQPDQIRSHLHPLHVPAGCYPAYLLLPPGDVNVGQLGPIVVTPADLPNVPCIYEDMDIVDAIGYANEAMQAISDRERARSSELFGGVDWGHSESLPDAPSSPLADFEVDEDASREANAILDHMAEKYGATWEAGMRLRALSPRFDFIQATWDPPTEANPEGVFELHDDERQRLRDTVVEAAMLSHQSFTVLQRLKADFRAKSSSERVDEFEVYLRQVGELEDAVNDGERALQAACEALEAAQEAKE